MKYLPSLPDNVAQELERFQRDHPNTARTAFIMMPFGTSAFYAEIASTIRQTCASLGVEALRVDDRAYLDDLFDNAVVYMYGCGFGIAVFDQTVPSVFNPNVALEVGYMRALGRKVCLLKDSRIAALPADLIGHLYRSFDFEQVATTLGGSLCAWLRDNDFETMPPNLEGDLTAESFRAYMRWRFPHEELFDSDAHFDRHWCALFTYRYHKLCDVDTLLNRTERAREFLFRGRRSDFAICQVSHAIALAHDEYLSEPVWKLGTIEEIRKARALL